MRTPSRRKQLRILVLDVGGKHVKAAISGQSKEWKIASGRTMTPEKLVRKVKKALDGEPYDAVAIGYPGVVTRGEIQKEPHNLAPGWVGFDLAKAFGRRTRIVNDAAMQALGSYDGGRMLFLGLGTGLGSAMVVEGHLAPMELSHLPYKKGDEFEKFVGESGLLRLGKKRWRKEVFEAVELLFNALEPDYVVLGGGNVHKLGDLPPGARRGDNDNAFVGGVRMFGLGGRSGRKGIPLLPTPVEASPNPDRGRPRSRGRATRA